MSPIIQVQPRRGRFILSAPEQGSCLQRPATSQTKTCLSPLRVQDPSGKDTLSKSNFKNSKKLNFLSITSRRKSLNFFHAENISLALVLRWFEAAVLGVVCMGGMPRNSGTVWAAGFGQPHQDKRMKTDAAVLKQLLGLFSQFCSSQFKVLGEET